MHVFGASQPGHVPPCPAIATNCKLLRVMGGGGGVTTQRDNTWYSHDSWHAHVVATTRPNPKCRAQLAARSPTAVPPAAVGRRSAAYNQPTIQPIGKHTHTHNNCRRHTRPPEPMGMGTARCKTIASSNARARTGRLPTSPTPGRPCPGPDPQGGGAGKPHRGTHTRAARARSARPCHGLSQPPATGWQRTRPVRPAGQQTSRRAAVAGCGSAATRAREDTRLTRPASAEATGMLWQARARAHARAHTHTRTCTRRSPPPPPPPHTRMRARPRRPSEAEPPEEGARHVRRARRLHVRHHVPGAAHRRERQRAARRASGRAHAVADRVAADLRVGRLGDGWRAVGGRLRGWLAVAQGQRKNGGRGGGSVVCRNRQSSRRPAGGGQRGEGCAGRLREEEAGRGARLRGAVAVCVWAAGRADGAH